MNKSHEKLEKRLTTHQQNSDGYSSDEEDFHNQPRAHLLVTVLSVLGPHVCWYQSKVRPSTSINIT